MNSADDISNSILLNSEPIISSSTSLSSSSTGNSIISYVTNINWTTWLIIILILAFLGFNIFTYLAKVTQDITNVFGPLIKKLFGVTLAVTGDIVDTSAQGAKEVVNETANVIDTGLSAVQNITPNTPNSNLKSSSLQPPDVASNNALNKSLNTAQHNNEHNSDYQANEAESTVNNSGKSGWCYIGSDRGFRSCAQVGVNDSCMSGEIFPSKEICINPSLRP
jgi:hypothetical protein